MKSYATIWPYFKQKWPLLFIGLLALVACDLLQLLGPWAVGRSIDLLTRLTVDRGALAGMALLIVGLAVAVAGTRYIWRRLIIGFSRMVERELRQRLYARLMALPLAWHQNKTRGDLIALATNDVESVRQAASLGLISLIDAFVMGVAAMIFMLKISPELTLIALLPMPLITILTKLFSRALYRAYLDVQESFGGLTEAIREELSGIRVLKAMSLEPLALERVERAGRLNLNQNIRLALAGGAFFPFMVFLTQLAVALVLYFGGRKAVAGEISPGGFVAFISYLGLLAWPMMALGLVFNLIQRGAVSLDRLNSVLYEPLPDDPAPPPAAGGGQAEKLAPAALSVTASHLTFAYPNRPKPALNDLSLVLPAGRVSALVGPTGSGKSTLAALLPRLITPPPGTLWVGGRLMEDWPVAELRRRIGYVSQDGYTFSGTILENAAFGRPEASREEVLAAVRLAGLAPDLAAMSQGLDTWVGERGLTLSGGQRQRLALARAILLDPPLLILDDTFSAVDAAVEEEILANLRPVRQGRTTLIISHRLTSLNGVDVIFVLEEGRVTASGTMAELIDREGYFKRIWALQMAGAASRAGRNLEPA